MSAVHVGPRSQLVQKVTQVSSNRVTKEQSPVSIGDSDGVRGFWGGVQLPYADFQSVLVLAPPYTFRDNLSPPIPENF